jgi:hypothetical protein
VNSKQVKNDGEGKENETGEGPRVAQQYVVKIQI